MTEERITTTEDPDGRTHTTHTTVIDDGERRGRTGAGTWVLLLILLLAVIAGIYFFSGVTDAQANKDNAIANAADQVGGAAEQVGNAAESAADKVTNSGN